VVWSALRQSPTRARIRKVAELACYVAFSEQDLADVDLAHIPEWLQQPELLLCELRERRCVNAVL
jgi:hypothetical protein